MTGAERRRMTGAERRALVDLRDVLEKHRETIQWMDELGIVIGGLVFMGLTLVRINAALVADYVERGQG